MESVDDFFRDVRELVEAFNDCTTPYDEAKDIFYEVTKFYEVPGACNYHYLWLTIFIYRS